MKLHNPQLYYKSFLSNGDLNATTLHSRGLQPFLSTKLPPISKTYGKGANQYSIWTLLVPKTFLYFPANGLLNPNSFITYNHLHAKRNIPRKFKLNRFTRFLGLMEQTNKQTRHTDRGRIVGKHYSC